ncbi:MAG: hypothetical protein V3T17_02420 [Pseudomonadales bacterium]
MTGYNTKLIDQPVIDEIFTNRVEALAALDILRDAFVRPFIKTKQIQIFH